MRAQPQPKPYSDAALPCQAGVPAAAGRDRYAVHSGRAVPRQTLPCQMFLSAALPAPPSRTTASLMAAGGSRPKRWARSHLRYSSLAVQYGALHVPFSKKGARGAGWRVETSMCATWQWAATWLGMDGRARRPLCACNGAHALLLLYDGNGACVRIRECRRMCMCASVCVRM